MGTLEIRIIFVVRKCQFALNHTVIHLIFAASKFGDLKITDIFTLVNVYVDLLVFTRIASTS